MIRELQAEGLHAQLFIIRGSTRERRKFQRIERQGMCGFGIERAQQRTGNVIEQSDHGSSSGNTCLSAPSGSGFTQRTAESGSLP